LIRAAHHLSKKKQNVFKNFLEQDAMDAWLVEALNEASTRSESLPLDAKLDAPRLYVFPVEKLHGLYLSSGSIVCESTGVWALVPD